MGGPIFFHPKYILLVIMCFQDKGEGKVEKEMAGL
jgi:hypothetical protein